VQHYGRTQVLNSFASSTEFQNILNNLCNAASYDADQDGLPDLFENQVANAFTPFYRVSGGETDNFATFFDVSAQTPNPSQTPKERFGRSPFSYFRVKPLGFATSTSGALFSVLKIDYLTLWDNDSGLLSGGLCAWNLFGLDDFISVLSDHPLDNERSAALVAAPVGSYSFNTNASAYYAYDYWTAGHEDTIADTSKYRRPSAPVPAGGHIELALTRSKHATYISNVDGLPLIPGEIIVGTYAALDLLLYYNDINEYEYIILTALATDVFFTCIVERFSDQGGSLANRRVNVGEPGRPINESGFIRVEELDEKLRKPLWILQ